MPTIDSVFIPEMWAARLQRHLDRKLIYAQPLVCNREWEGEISQAGDTVHIQKIGNPEIKEYEPGKGIESAEEPDGTTLALIVDAYRYFNVKVNSVEKAQVNLNLLDSWAKRAGVGMAQAIDAFVAAKMVAAATINKLGADVAPITVDPAHDEAGGKSSTYTPYQMAVELRRQLAAQDAPLEEGLWIAISPDFEAKILEDPKYISDTETGAAVVRNGRIGTIAGFEVLRTTGVPVTDKGGEGEDTTVERILAGVGNYATTFANQVTEMKAYEPEDDFGDAVKGLEVFGAKVLEPETLAVAHVAGEVNAGSGSGSGSGSGA